MALTSHLPAGRQTGGMARLVEIDPDSVKLRMKELGYAGIPGKPDERVKAFHAIKDYKPVAQQSGLALDDTDKATAALQSAQGVIG